MFDYYGLAISDVSIAGVFELALAEKQTTQNVNPETIKRDRQTFNRFIISDFGARDIREISKVELRAYTQEWFKEFIQSKQHLRHIKVF